jgi:putative protein kinase ArgK-like GTPase of G3E family
MNPEAPGLCNLCQKIEEEAAQVCEAERAAMRARMDSVQEQIRAAVREHSADYLDSRAYKASQLRKRIHEEAEAARAQLRAERAAQQTLF